MADSVARILVDAEGNQIGVLLDGAVYRLAVDAKTTLQDEDGNNLSTDTEGNIHSISVKDKAAEQLLTDMLLELKKITKHFEQMTESVYNNIDVED